MIVCEGLVVSTVADQETVQKIHVPHNSATPESYFLSDEPVLSIDNEDRGKGCSSQAGI